MNIKQLKSSIAKMPDDATVELSRMLAIDTKKEKGQRDAYEVILDFPIIGIAYSEETNEARLLIELAPGITVFGQVRRFAEEIPAQDRP